MKRISNSSFSKQNKMNRVKVAQGLALLISTQLFGPSVFAYDREEIQRTRDRIEAYDEQIEDKREECEDRTEAVSEVDRHQTDSAWIRERFPEVQTDEIANTQCRSQMNSCDEQVRIRFAAEIRSHAGLAAGAPVTVDQARAYLSNGPALSNFCHVLYTRAGSNLDSLGDCGSVVSQHWKVRAAIEVAAGRNVERDCENSIERLERSRNRLRAEISNSQAECPQCAMIEAMRPREPGVGDYIVGGLSSVLGAALGGYQTYMGWQGYNNYLGAFNSYSQQCVQVGIPCGGPMSPFGMGMGGMGMGMGGMGMGMMPMGAGSGIASAFSMGMGGMGMMPYSMGMGMMPMGAGIGIASGFSMGMGGMGMMPYSMGMGMSPYAMGMGMATAMGMMPYSMGMGMMPMGAGIGIASGFSMGMGMSPYAMGMGMATAMGMSGYSMGMGMSPYSMGMASSMGMSGYSMGMGMSPYSMGMSGMGYGHDASLAQASMQAQMLAYQRAQMQSQNAMIAQQQMMEAQMRYQSTLMSTYSYGGGIGLRPF